MISTAEILACLDPRAPQLSNHIAAYSAILCAAMILVSAFLSSIRRDAKWTVCCVVVLAFHPAWTMSAYVGDCGFSKRFFSVAAAAVVLSILLLQAARPAARLRNFMLALTVLAWIAVGIQVTYWRLGVISARFSDNSAFQSFAMSSGGVKFVAVVLTAACGATFALSRITSRAHRL